MNGARSVLSDCLPKRCAPVEVSGQALRVDVRVDLTGRADPVDDVKVHRLRSLVEVINDFDVITLVLNLGEVVRRTDVERLTRIDRLNVAHVPTPS